MAQSASATYSGCTGAYPRPFPRCCLFLLAPCRQITILRLNSAMRSFFGTNDLVIYLLCFLLEKIGGAFCFWAVSLLNDVVLYCFPLLPSSQLLTPHNIIDAARLSHAISPPAIPNPRRSARSHSFRQEDITPNILRSEEERLGVRFFASNKEIFFSTQCGDAPVCKTYRFLSSLEMRNEYCCACFFYTLQGSGVKRLCRDADR